MVTLNLHINYSCPLKCRYCEQRLSPDIWKYQLSAEEMIREVEVFMKFRGVDKCNVNISGGEPTLKFEDMKKLMEAFPDNSYEVSTSGYLLDREKCEFFSRYHVTYVLSVDGTEKVTNYLRPLANGEPGYFKQLKNNMRYILYYSPKTRAKLIVPRRFIPEIYDTYLGLERIGFKEIFITPNVYENEVDNEHPNLATGAWGEEDWNLYTEQIAKIMKQIEIGTRQNKKRCLISNVTMAAAKMMYPDNGEFNQKKMICPVFDYKGGIGPEKGQIDGEKLYPISFCCKIPGSGIDTQEELLRRAKEDYQKVHNKCPIDESCPWQESCMYSVCIAENIKGKSGNIFQPTMFQCKTQKVYQSAAFYLLNFLPQIKNPCADRIWMEIKKGGDFFGCETPNFLHSC